MEPDETDMSIWNNEVTVYVTSKVQLDQNIQKAYGILIQQCTDNLKDQVEASPYLKLFKTNTDVLLLVDIIKNIVLKFRNKRSLQMHCTWGQNCSKGTTNIRT